MGLGETIDTSFDFRSDTPPGQDPDSHSPTLRRYHQLLWSKPLPSGAPFELDVTTPHTYLHHRSELGESRLSSDAVIPSFSRARELKHIIDQIPEVETAAFNGIGYTIGGMGVFPGYQVDRKMTINQARNRARRLQPGSRGSAATPRTPSPMPGRRARLRRAGGRGSSEQLRGCRAQARARRGGYVAQL